MAANIEVLARNIKAVPELALLPVLSGFSACEACASFSIALVGPVKLSCLPCTADGKAAVNAWLSALGQKDACSHTECGIPKQYHLEEPPRTGECQQNNSNLACVTRFSLFRCLPHAYVQMLRSYPDSHGVCAHS